MAVAGSGTRFGMFVHHTDAERVFACDRKVTVGILDEGLDGARRRSWTVVDMKKDWSVIWKPVDTSSSQPHGARNSQVNRLFIEPKMAADSIPRNSQELAADVMGTASRDRAWKPAFFDMGLPCRNFHHTQISVSGPVQLSIRFDIILPWAVSTLCNPVSGV